LQAEGRAEVGGHGFDPVVAGFPVLRDPDERPGVAGRRTAENLDRADMRPALTGLAGFGSGGHCFRSLLAKATGRAVSAAPAHSRFVPVCLLSPPGDSSLAHTVLPTASAAAASPGQAGGQAGVRRGRATGYQGSALPSARTML